MPMPLSFCRCASSVFPLSRLRSRSSAFLAAKVVILSIVHGGKSSTRGVKEHYYADFQEKLPIKAGRRRYLFSETRSYNIRIYKVHPEYGVIEYLNLSYKLFEMHEPEKQSKGDV